MANFKYEITERIAILSENNEGWTKELNKVSWNGRAPKYDLRAWNHKTGRTGRGTTLSDEEIANLREVLNAIEI
jgi:hypothetical protein